MLKIGQSASIRCCQKFTEWTSGFPKLRAILLVQSAFSSPVEPVEIHVPTDSSQNIVGDVGRSLGQTASSKSGSMKKFMSYSRGNANSPETRTTGHIFSN